MKTTLRRDKIDAAGIRQRLGETYWKPATPLGDDGWVFDGRYIAKRIIVSFDPDSEPGVDWIHASISYGARNMIPSYADLKRLHAAVFGDGYAYQCFVPPDDHINITSNVLHLWGRHDGARVLPDFGRLGTI